MQLSYLQEDSGSAEFPNIYVSRDEKQPKFRNTRPINFNIADTQYDVVERVG